MAFRFGVGSDPRRFNTRLLKIQMSERDNYSHRRPGASGSVPFARSRMAPSANVRPARPSMSARSSVNAS